MGMKLESDMAELGRVWDDSSIQQRKVKGFKNCQKSRLSG